MIRNNEGGFFFLNEPWCNSEFRGQLKSTVKEDYFSFQMIQRLFFIGILP